MDWGPELLCEPTARLRNVILDDSHLVWPSGVQSMPQRDFEGALLHCAGRVRVFRERLEDAPPDDVVARALGQAEVGVGSADNDKIGVEDKIGLRHPHQDGGEIRRSGKLIQLVIISGRLTPCSYWITSGLSGLQPRPHFPARET
ncbi:hypothetical protein D3C73_781460 [compost metagenome]